MTGSAIDCITQDRISLHTHTIKQTLFPSHFTPALRLRASAHVPRTVRLSVLTQPAWWPGYPLLSAWSALSRCATGGARH